MTNKPGFAHLHCHSQYSFLDGACRVEKLIEKVKKNKMDSIALTDHGVMSGLPSFQDAADKAGIKSILGLEAYLVLDRHIKEPRETRYHLTMLAENNKGYENLCHLSNYSFTEGFYHKPRCLAPESLVHTPDGSKPISEISVGDFVLTHKGRFRPVKRVMKNPHEGRIYGVTMNNRYGSTVWLTGEHPCLIRDRQGRTSWVEASKILPGRASKKEEMSSWNSFACLPKLSKIEKIITEIKTTDFITDWQPSDKREGHFEKEISRPNMG